MARRKPPVDWVALLQRLGGATVVDVARETDRSYQCAMTNLKRLVESGEVRAQQRRWGNGTWYFVVDDD